MKYIIFSFFVLVAAETREAGFLVPAFLLMAIDVGRAYVQAMSEMNKPREKKDKKRSDDDGPIS